MRRIHPEIWFLGIFLILVVTAVIVLMRSPAQLSLEPQHNLSSTAHPSSTLPYLNHPLVSQLPPFVGITRWWNTPNDAPLSLDALKGKVVLIDFWTYSCINCIRTQPVLRAWWDAYEKDGLVIVGVHTPEFAFERDPANVESALRTANLKFPIALDPAFGTWNSYGNRYWPAKYLYDREGKLRLVHFGEGEYAETEAAIRELLSEGKPLDKPLTGADSSPTFAGRSTPETYFGTQRMDAFANASELAPTRQHTYTLKAVGRDEWSVGGAWTFQDERTIGGKDARFQMNVQSNAMHLVFGSVDGAAKRVRIRIDGRDPLPAERTTDTKTDATGAAFLTISEEKLYRVARFPDGGRHTIELTLESAGIALYAATFGE